MTKERWKKLDLYENYEVSNLGKIRFTTRGNKLKVKKFSNGFVYPRVEICKNGRRYRPLVHLLVAQAFVPNPNKKLEVNHKNGNKYDNRAENLEWVTRSENMKHAFQTGLCIARKGEKSNLSRFNKVDILCIRGLSNIFSYATIAFLFGMSATNVASIVNRESWNEI